MIFPKSGRRARTVARTREIAKTMANGALCRHACNCNFSRNSNSISTLRESVRPSGLQPLQGRTNERGVVWRTNLITFSGAKFHYSPRGASGTEGAKSKLTEVPHQDGLHVPCPGATRSMRFVSCRPGLVALRVVTLARVVGSFGLPKPDGCELMSKRATMVTATNTTVTRG